MGSINRGSAVQAHAQRPASEPVFSNRDAAGRTQPGKNTALQAKAPQFRWLLSSCALEEENNPHESRLVLMGCRMGHLYLHAGQGTVHCQWSPW